jgi:hypothetical protein
MTPPIPELERLNVFIGRWLTEGETVAEGTAPALPIVASDVYEWAPGGHFLMHPAYGRIGSVAVGGLEVIGYDASTGQFQTLFSTAREHGPRDLVVSRRRMDLAREPCALSRRVQ